MSKQEKSQKKAKKNKKSKQEKSQKIKTRSLEIELRVATKEDFIELDKYLEGGKKKWKMRIGLPYWLINVAGEIENDPYILDENTDKGDFADWLIREQVLIPLKRFEK